MANALANETSPYLLQHQDHPVEWVPWSDAASEDDLNPWPAPFDKPFHLVLNLAVGGQFLGNPDKSTPFPARMEVGYVRVYEKEGGYGEVSPRGEGKMPFAK